MAFGDERVARLTAKRRATLEQGILAYLESCPSGELRQITDTAATLAGYPYEGRHTYDPKLGEEQPLSFYDPRYQDVWALMNVMVAEGKITYLSHRGFRAVRPKEEA